MNDRELLELAAKAAGYDIHIWGTKGKENIARMDLQNNPRWNPLTDDGDALRLAVKLNINIEHLKTMNNKYAGVSCYPIGMGDCGIIEENENDKYSATRRAIVSAAAEIGKTK